MNPIPTPIPTETPDPSRRSPAWWPWMPNRLRHEPWRWLVVISGLQVVFMIAANAVGQALFGEPSPRPNHWLLESLLGSWIAVGLLIACPVLALRQVKTPPVVLVLAGCIAPVAMASTLDAVSGLVGLVEGLFLSLSFVTWLAQSISTAFWLTWLQFQLVLLVSYVLHVLAGGPASG